MKRAVVLIVVLSVLCVSVSLIGDHMQASNARAYLKELRPVRKALKSGDFTDAYARQSLIEAKWRYEKGWLNTFISHHHTREVSTAMLRLATAIEMGWQVEALEAMDILQDCLEDIETSDGLRWENFF